MMTPQQLKNSILQYAVQGKLVPQIPAEGTAHALFDQIQTEKKALIRAGKLKKEKPLPPISPDEIPFDIPDSWMWVRLGELLYVINGVSYKKDDVVNNGLRVLRGGNIQDMNIYRHDDDVFLPLTYDDPKKHLNIGDIIIVASTGSKTVIGKPGYVKHDLPNTMIGAFLRICRPFDLRMKLYLKYIFQSEFYRKHIRDLSQGTNINNIKESYITKFVIPLPPLSEQRRIVAKLEELLPLCEALK